MRIADSRRLTGANLLLDGPGAHLEVALHGVDPQAAIAAWREALAPLLAGVGWSGAPVASRAHAQGVSLAFGAPIDALYAATDVNEAAWHRAAARLGGEDSAGEERGRGHADTLEDAAGDGDEDAPIESLVATLAARIAAERNPALIALAATAQARGPVLLSDDRRVSLGMGRYSRSWPVAQMPVAPERVRWNGLGNVPVALVTGTNGKTTTVRLLGAMARAAGIVAGVTSTDRVTVGDEVVAVGDYSGPNGARTVLRDRRVEMAMLEVARGGLLRRGLAVPRADAAIVTNVANDHLGEFGIFDVASLAEAKLIVAKAIGPDGRVVLNADDPLLLERGVRLRAPVLWFTLDAAHPAVARHVAAGGDACLLEGDALMRVRGGRREVVARTGEVPIAFGGAARHNLANALAAIGAAGALGLPLEAIHGGLTGFESSPDANPGRANVWNLAGVHAVVDFAHNPHGLAALADMAGAMPARRRALVIGQAGDRDDAAIREFARAAWRMAPDRVFVKEMESFLRGRAKHVVPEMIEAELVAAGAPAAALERAGSEMDAVRAALAWAREGDLLLLTTHADRDAVIALLRHLEASGWRPGAALPRSEASPAS